MGQASPILIHGTLVGDLSLSLRSLSPDIKIKLNKNTKNCFTTVRAVMGVFPSFCFRDEHHYKPLACPYIPDANAVENHIAGTMHRFGTHMSFPNGFQKRDFYLFSVSFLDLWLVPMPQDKITNMREHLKNSKYSVRTQENMLTAVKNLETLQNRSKRNCFGNKSFVKVECHDSFKIARIINFLDEFRVLLGPIQHDIDQWTISSIPWFVKGSDPRDWPRKLKEEFGDGAVMETDFTSMESHHRDVFSHVVLYWMRLVLGGDKDLISLFSALYGGLNVCEFKTCTVTLRKSLMSGAPWTSLANGVLNLCIMAYLKFRTLYHMTRAGKYHIGPKLLARIARSRFRGFVEGDDGITLCDKIDPGLIERLGLKMEPKFHKNFSEAKFCGVICDSDELKVHYDPRKFIRRFFVLPVELQNAREVTKMRYMRSKAISYKMLYPSSPVISIVCDIIIERTRGYSSVEFNKNGIPYLMQWIPIDSRVWRRKADVTLKSRLFVSERYDFPVDLQILCEKRALEKRDSIQLPFDEIFGLSNDEVSYCLGIFLGDWPISIPKEVASVVKAGGVNLKKRLRQVDFCAPLESISRFQL